MNAILNAQTTLPWLEAQQLRLKQAASSGRLGGGWLIGGEQGAGALWLARWTAALALCKSASAPCGHCVACKQVFDDQHPDCQFIGLQEEAQEIKVEQLRALIAGFSLTSHGGGAKVCIIAPAERMNRFAANALLKTLEEPSGRALLILVAEQPTRLLATLRSRCQQLSVPKPTQQAAAEWLSEKAGPGRWAELLALVGNAPLQALQLDAEQCLSMWQETRDALRPAELSGIDPVMLAEAWSRTQPVLRLRIIENWLTERIFAWARSQGTSDELRVDAQLHEGGEGLNIRMLFGSLEALREARALAETPVNRTLMLERLLWMLRGAATQRRPRWRSDPT